MYQIVSNEHFEHAASLIFAPAWFTGDRESMPQLFLNLDTASQVNRSSSALHLPDRGATGVLSQVAPLGY